MKASMADDTNTPPPDTRKLLAARLVGLGAIPIAVFCAVCAMASARARWQLSGSS